MYSQEVKNFHDFNMTSIEGASVSLADFSGIARITALKCGLLATAIYNSMNCMEIIVVIGFP